MAHSIADDHVNPIQQRTVLLATDNKNSVLAEVVAGRTNRMAYSAYGHQSAQQEVMTRLGFNGELREARIGWYLLGNGYRAYNPRLMRFHSPDSWSPFGRGGLNAYMFCGGEPVMRSDPSGHYFGRISWGAQKLAGGISAAVNQTVSITTSAVSRTASTISSVASQVSGAVQSAKKAFTETFFFDPEALRRIGPPPKKVIHTKAPNHVFHSNRYPDRPNEVRRQQVTNISGSSSGTQSRRGTDTASSISNNRGNSSSFNPRGSGTGTGNRPEPYDHVMNTRASDNVTTLLSKERGDVMTYRIRTTK